MATNNQITQHKRFVPYGTHPNPALFVTGKLNQSNEYVMALLECGNSNEIKVLGFFYAGNVIRHWSQNEKCKTLDYQP